MTNRNRAWADTRAVAFTLLDGGSLLFDLLTDAPTVDTLTVVRLVGDLTVDFDPTSAPVDSMQVIDVGIGVTSSEALLAGVVSLPKPSIPTEYPPRGWLYAATQSTWETVDSFGIGHESARFKFDIRSMRKIDKGKLFMLIISTNAKGAGFTTLVSGRVRALCLT